MIEKSENRGGKRPNAGRKNLSLEEKKQTKVLFRRVPIELFEEIQKLVDSFLELSKKIKK